MNVIPTRLHGVLDYVMGILLIAAPWLFGFAFGGAETWVPVVLGSAVVLYSLFTRYEAGVIPALGMRTHLWLDGAGGALLAVSPWLFGFADTIWWPHVLLGILEFGTALLTRTRPAQAPAPTAQRKKRPPDR